MVITCSFVSLAVNNVKFTTNESHFFVKVLTRHTGARAVWVSLIPGLKYGMEQWNGKWNGMEYVQL